MKPLPVICPKHIAPGSQQRASAPLPVKRKASLACSNCRAKRRRCNGQKPFCSECVMTHQRCVYENCDKRKKETWKATVNDLQQMNQRLEATIEALKCNDFDEAVERLRRLRKKGSALEPNAASGSIADAAVAVAVDTESRSSSQTIPLYTSPATGSAAHTSRSDSSITVELDATLSVGPFALPPKETTRRAVSAFFMCGGSLFYIMPPEECEVMITTVYERPTVATKSMLSQLCALAVIGSHYCTDEIPASTKENYYQYALLLLQDEEVVDDLSLMRVHVCISMYLIMLKSTTARSMIGSGLNIARANMQVYAHISGANWVERARVIRTLSFIECWLSSSLGYKADLRPEEIQLVNRLAESESLTHPTNELSAVLIQQHVFKIAFLSSQVYDNVNSAAYLSMGDLKQFSAYLDTWLSELPHCMRLSSLVTDDGSAISNFAAANRPLLFLHMMHITSQLTLYERVLQFILKQSLSPSDELAVREVLRLPADIHRAYECYAQCLARMVKLLYDKDCILARCWLTINACYHSSIVLLMNTALFLALGEKGKDEKKGTALAENGAGNGTGTGTGAKAGDRPDLENVSDALSHVRCCLQVLDICEDWDIAAMRLVDIVRPLHQRLSQMVDSQKVDRPDPALAASTSSYPIPDTNESDGNTDCRQVQIPIGLAHIVHQSVAAMELPYQEVWV
ncbi:hypothetical protein BDW66DRAFT_128305 [Aspergillus desertorum]